MRRRNGMPCPTATSEKRASAVFGSMASGSSSIERPRMPQDFAPVLPAPLRPGARIAVIAPSSPFDRTLVFRGLGWLAGRYRLEWDRSLFERQGYLAGSDERRLTELD